MQRLGDCALKILLHALLCCMLTGALLPSSSLASGDFPLASCKSWNGTITKLSGLNTARATMQGSVATPDVQEYCERDPGGETIAYGGKLTIDQCVARYKREVKNIRLEAVANCNQGILSFSYGPSRRQKVKFPISAETDQSCASGLPPLREQFKILCPAAASTHNVTVKVLATFLGGRMRKVDVNYTADLVYSSVKAVVNCNRSYPQVEIDGQNAEVDLRNAEEYSLPGRPLKSIWKKACE